MRRVEEIERDPNDEAWEAVLTRDRSQDGLLFYGVRTTGVFCRPSCPSRRPKRENAVFFRSAEEASKAGYRACHRCHPESAFGTTTEKRLRRAMQYLDSHLDTRVTLEQLGAVVGLSPFHLQRAFREAVGVSPRAYQHARRLAVMKERLRDGEQIGRAVWNAGYGSVRGAYEAAGSGLGMTPGEYRSGGGGIAIRYSLHETALGHLIVAWTPKGVCAVLLGDSPDQLRRELEAEFPAAALAAGEGAEREWVEAVLTYLQGRHTGLVVPVDLHGTAFQLRVWRALQEIPPGEVRSYGELAAAIGSPGSARAVARACAANRAALVVPCHRAVRADGATGGYRWGERRKRDLLDLEQRLQEPLEGTS
jgi:AraC family transcriptional regulator, regulatory protein of adaptative response / methylated-DNA-[protein]-cysteine methyltransferase